MSTSNKSASSSGSPEFPSDDVLVAEATHLMYNIWRHGPAWMTRDQLIDLAKKVRTGEAATDPKVLRASNRRRYHRPIL